MPTNIVVLNEQNIFIRDNRGVYRFNLDSKDLSYISGTAQSNKMRMTVVNGKVFATAGNNLLVLEADKNEVSQTIPFKEKFRQLSLLMMGTFGCQLEVIPLLALMLKI